MILPDCNLDRGADKAEMLRVRVAALSESHGAEISASFGVAAVPYTSTGVTALLGHTVQHLVIKLCAVAGFIGIGDVLAKVVHTDPQP